MADMDERPGVTFGEIFRAIGKRIWAVLAAVVLAAVLAALAAHFLYDPYGSVYRLTFTLAFPDMETNKYPDGSPFYYRDIISADALAQTKNADGRFADVDTEKLAQKDSISIAADEEGETGRYTLTVKAGYFSDRAEATDFLNALARRAVLRAAEIARSVDYGLDEGSFAGASFEEKISLLAKQRENLLGQYDVWIALYRGGYAVAGKTLVNHRAEADIVFGEAAQRSLTSELETNGYVSLGLLEAERKALEAERAENEKKIEALKEALSQFPASSAAYPAYPAAYPAAETEGSGTASAPLGLSETLAALLVRNVEIASRLDALTEENITAFDARLTEIYSRMQEAAEKAQAVCHALYEQEARVYFETARAVQEGDLDPILAAVGGAIVGGAAACIAVCAVEIPKARKRAISAGQDGGTEQNGGGGDKEDKDEKDGKDDKDEKEDKDDDKDKDGGAKAGASPGSAAEREGS